MHRNSNTNHSSTKEQTSKHRNSHTNHSTNKVQTSKHKNNNCSSSNFKRLSTEIVMRTAPLGNIWLMIINGLNDQCRRNFKKKTSQCFT
jgi:hypothetical protein